MPTKIGNGGHGHENYDPETGQYVETPTSGSENNQELNSGSVYQPPSLSVDGGLSAREIGKIAAFLKNKREGFVLGKTLEECQNIGNQILGGKRVVFYDPKTDLRYINEMNNALFDLTRDFGNLIKPTLERYGSAESLPQDVIKEITSRSIERLKASIPEEFLQKDPSIKMEFLNDFDDMRKRLFSNSEAKDSTYAYSWGESIYSLKLGKTFFPFNKTKYSLNQEEILGIKAVVVFNSNHLFGETRYQKERETEGRSYAQGGFHYQAGKGAAYATASHELGHHVDGILRNFMSSEEKMEIYKMIKPIMAGSDRWGHGGDERASIYAKTNDREFVAEAFSDVYSNGAKALDFNQKIVDYYKAMYKKYFVKNKGE